MAWDFASDSTRLNDVSKELKYIASEIRSKTKEIYGLLENDLNNYWRNSAYQEFVAGCGNYKVPLEDLAKTLEVFGDKLNKTASSTEHLLSDIDNVIK